MTPTPEAFSRLNLYTALHSIPDGVTLANAEGRIVFSNHAADQILGMTAATEASPDEWAEHYGVFLPDGETPFPTDRYPLVRALKGEIAKDVEMLIRNAQNPDGVLISASGRRLFDGDGTAVGAVVVFRDITELRRVQKELETTNARLTVTQELKDELVSYVVHDLKGPLTTILTLADLILSGEDTRDQMEDDVRGILLAGRRLSSLVMDLLDVHVAEDGALELSRSNIAVAAFLDEAGDAAVGRVGGARDRIVIEADDDLRLHGDRSLLMRLVLNLVDNCVKYGPDDGTIRIEATRGSKGRVRLGVTDEGPGVPEHLRERIFDRYARAERDSFRSEDSRGLGLRFCKVVADAHGGEIWVEDAEPRGARFCVELPQVDVG